MQVSKDPQYMYVSVYMYIYCIIINLYYEFDAPGRKWYKKFRIGEGCWTSVGKCEVCLEEV